MRLNRRTWFDSHPLRITDKDGYTRAQRRTQRQIEAAVDRKMREYFPTEPR